MKKNGWTDAQIRTYLDTLLKLKSDKEYRMEVSNNMSKLPLTNPTTDKNRLRDLRNKKYQYTILGHHCGNFITDPNDGIVAHLEFNDGGAEREFPKRNAHLRFLTASG